PTMHQPRLSALLSSIFRRFDAKLKEEMYFSGPSYDQREQSSITLIKFKIPALTTFALTMAANQSRFASIDQPTSPLD
ncbi:hypothetical protein, partial [Bartonella sp. CL32QHWL-2]|uniref:hypothetical protein n=1 Tax=Bartonella sp. CL32QHWL-2 TaxID=3243525 RepID=UPI0035CF4415